jgi:hypothetical protein
MGGVAIDLDCRALDQTRRLRRHRHKPSSSQMSLSYTVPFLLRDSCPFVPRHLTANPEEGRDFQPTS